MPPGSSASQADGITRLLNAWQEGDTGARDQLFVVVYDELRRRAAGKLRRERPGHTLRPTALVHEAYLRLLGQDRVRWQNRAQFFAIASEMMRRVLVDHARDKKARKREGAAVRVALEEDVAAVQPREVDLLALDDALSQLAALNARQGRIVELRFFGGLSTPEIAEVLEVSQRTVDREWHFARTWLYRRMAERSRAEVP
jgi:RNA polymerase sigma factor (TIGR02999 family)